MKPIYTIIAFCMPFLLFSTMGMARQPAPTATAQEVTVPNLIKLAGALKDPDGLPRIGMVEIKFGLYTSKEGGDPLWNETQLVQTDAEGNYSVYLGASEKTGLPLELFGTEKARWLGIQVEEEEEQARVLFAAVPYALKALDTETIGGKPISSFVLYEDLPKAVEKASSFAVVGVQSLKAAVGDLNSAALTSGTPGMVAKFDTDGISLVDSMITEKNGRIGINTPNPISKLHLTTQGVADYFTLSAYQADIFDKGFLMRAAKGTSNAPGAVSKGNGLLNIYAQGYDGNDYSVAAGITVAVDGSVSPGKVPGRMLFQVADQSGTLWPKMQIDSRGFVGIGLVIPSALLHVENLQPAPTADLKGIDPGTILYVNGADGGETFAFGGTGGRGANVYINGGNGGSATGGTGGHGGDITLQPGDAGRGFNASMTGTSGNVILGPDNGSVGIGTKSPSQKLEVDGGARLNTATAKPACNAGSRGTFWFTQNGIGVKDSAEVCAKDGSDSYGWRTIY